MTEEKIENWLKKYAKIKSKKTSWLDLWQYCGKYVHGTKMNFTEYNDEGSLLNEDVFDSTAIKANKRMANALIGMLWQGGGKSIRIDPVDQLPSTKDVKKYFEMVSRKVTRALDDPRAGMVLALEGYMLDQGAFGTSGVGVFPGEESALVFNAWGIDEISIEEGENGYIRTIYREFEIPLSRAMDDYGLDSLSDDSRKAIEEGNTSDRIRLLHIISKRSREDRRGENKDPFLSITIEVEAKKLLKESSFKEFPVPVARFMKRRNEVYGRSPAMDALPDILELNATKEARISAIEKSLDPPLGVYDDSILGNEEIDTSAGGINVFAASGRIGDKPIFPLFTVETIREADKSIEDLRESINEHFNIDRLLDFNNEAEMTLGEAQMRQRIRNEALGSFFSRQYNELFTPLIERAVAILWRAGELGILEGSDEEAIAKTSGRDIDYVPKAVAELIASGQDFYNIVYLSPAARMLETAEAEGVVRTWEFAGGIAKMAPTILDNLDADASLKIIARTSGAPSQIMFSKEAVDMIRQEQQKQMQIRQQMEMQKLQAEAAKGIGEAEIANKEAFGNGQGAI